MEDFFAGKKNKQKKNKQKNKNPKNFSPRMLPYQGFTVFSNV